MWGGEYYVNNTDDVCRNVKRSLGCSVPEIRKGKRLILRGTIDRRTDERERMWMTIN